MAEHVEVKRTEGGGATALVGSDRDERRRGGGGEESTEPRTNSASGWTACELPWNSVGSILRQWTGGLGVPTITSAGDLKLEIEGKLVEMDPANVTVTLIKVEGGVHISSEDYSGVFHSADPTVDTATQEGHAPSDMRGDPLEVNTTRSVVMRGCVRRSLAVGRWWKDRKVGLRTRRPESLIGGRGTTHT